MNKIEEFFLKNKPKFLVGAVNIDQLPIKNIPEVAFVGRSNVGKSSLINAITRSDIAIASKTPGRTRQLNFFNIADKINFVDMPGYGFAKASKKDIENWNELIFKYLLGRVHLKRLFLLIDSRRGIKDNDLEVMKVLDNYAVLYQVVLTKTDEVKKEELEKVLNNTKKESIKHVAMLEEVLTCSSKNNVGLDKLRENIYNLM